MKLLILTEGGAKMGFGHLTRMITVAQAVLCLAPRPEVRFVVNGDARAQSYLKKLGLNSENDDWIKNWDNWEQFVRNADSVLIDSYHVSLALSKRIAKTNSNCFWMDDYGRMAYPAGTIIVPAPYGFPRSVKLPREVSVLAGNKYVILRDEFNKVKAKYCVRKKISRVLILLGGTGAISDVKKIVQKLNERSAEKLKFDWIAPKKMDDLKNLSLKIYSAVSAKRLINLMLKCDLAVSAGGQTLYELASLGVPTISFQIASNQRLNVDCLKSAGAAYFAGIGFNLKSMKQLKHLFSVLSSPAIRRKCSLSGVRLINKYGANRIAARITGKSKND